jgi:hypothetical protein
LAFFFEGEFTLLVVVFVLSSTTILASLLLRALAVVRGVGIDCGDEGVGYLSLILRHICDFSWSSLVCIFFLMFRVSWKREIPVFQSHSCCNVDPSCLMCWRGCASRVRR